MIYGQWGSKRNLDTAENYHTKVSHTKINQITFTPPLNFFVPMLLLTDPCQGGVQSEGQYNSGQCIGEEDSDAQSPSPDGTHPQELLQFGKEVGHLVETGHLQDCGEQQYLLLRLELWACCDVSWGCNILLPCGRLCKSRLSLKFRPELFSTQTT